MMGKILQLIPQLNTDLLYEQLSVSKGVTGKAQEFVAQYLLDCGIDSLDAITVEDLLDYRKYVRSLLMKKEQKAYYENLLEQVCFAYLISMNSQLSESAADTLKSCAIRNKVIGFMLICGIGSTDDIDYELRSDFQTYLNATLPYPEQLWKRYIEEKGFTEDEVRLINQPYYIDASTTHPKKPRYYQRIFSIKFLATSRPLPVIFHISRL